MTSINDRPNALRILREEHNKSAASLPVELVDEVYRIEFRVQFDDTRRDVLSRLKQAINNLLDAEDLKGPRDADAI